VSSKNKNPTLRMWGKIEWGISVVLDLPSSSQRGSTESDSNIVAAFKTIVFYSIPAPREHLQRVMLMRSVYQNHSILQHSSLQRGPAVQ
jgi:hypothetical protein